MPPIPRVSTRKYPARLAEVEAAKVRFRVKGSDTEGVVYQGQQVIKECVGCAAKRVAAPVITPPVQQPRYYRSFQP